MANFLQRVEPALLSGDSNLQLFAVRILKGTYLATSDTLFTAIEAFDQGRKSGNPKAVLPHASFMPIDEKVLEEIVTRMERIEETDESIIWFIRLINNASTDLLLSYKDRLKPFVHEEFMANLKEIKELDSESLFAELDKFVEELGKNWHNSSLYSLGERIVDELILRGEITQSQIENGIRRNLEEQKFMQYEGIYAVYMAGETRTESVIPELSKILDKDNEGEIALEEVKKALIKIGTDEVVQEVEKVALNESNFYFSIDVLGKIKTKKAEEALLRLFDQTKNLTALTLIADALCQHLSVEAIPKVIKLIETGYDRKVLSLEESLYASMMINGVDHPALPGLKHKLDEEERRREERNKEFDRLSIPVRRVEGKVGRNDPCPCGSGKKYKKCCGK